MMVNWFKGKLGLTHDHYVNVKELFKYYDFGFNRPRCTICGEII